MAVEIPTARYWRIQICRIDTSSGYASAVCRVVTLRLTDSGGTPLPHSAVTNAGVYSPINGTVMTSLADSNIGTDVQWGGNGFYNWGYGGYAVRYDMGSPVKPAKLLTRFSDALTTLGWVGGSYSMVWPTMVYAYIEASTDDVNWNIVSRIATMAPGGFNVDNLVAIDSTPAFHYTSDIKKPISGDGGIYGIVTEDGIPVARQVLLLEREFFTPIRRTISTADGAYSFTNLNRDREYAVLAIDSTEEPGQPGVYKNALIRDRITPIPANGLPTDGLPWFFRVRRSMRLTPACQWNFYGPGTKYTGAYAFGRGAAIRNATLVDTDAGGGYDLRGIPIPVPVGLRAVYPKSLYPTQISSGHSASGAEWTIELIAEIPSGSDPTAVYAWSGIADYPGYPWGYALGNQYGPVLEILSSGTVNFRLGTSLSNAPAVRATGSATPGTIAHILVAYRESQEACLYINGVLAQNASMAGLGEARVVGPAANPGTWTSVQSQGSHVGVVNSRMRRINAMFMHAGAPLTYSMNSSSTRMETGTVWAAVYDHSVYTDPDAGGVPISVRDLYESWANNAVWTGGSRPSGWPTAPSFSGYGIEVAADAPAMWFRLQDLSNTDYVQALGSKHMGGYFTQTGITYQRPGMTAGLNSIGFSANGALRIAGALDFATANDNYLSSGYTVSEVGTIEFWMRPSAFSKAQGTIFHTYTPDTNIARLWVYTNTSGNIAIRFQDSAGSVFTYTFTKVFSAGTAYHVAIVWDGVVTNKVTLYVDGEKYSDSGFFFVPSDNLANATYNASLGNIVDNPTTLPPYNGTISADTYTYNGDLQDFAVYSYPLSAARIAAHYAARNI